MAGAITFKLLYEKWSSFHSANQQNMWNHNGSLHVISKFFPPKWLSSTLPLSQVDVKVLVTSKRLLLTAFPQSEALSCMRVENGKKDNKENIGLGWESVYLSTVPFASLLFDVWYLGTCERFSMSLHSLFCVLYTFLFCVFLHQVKKEHNFAVVCLRMQFAYVSEEGEWNSAAEGKWAAKKIKRAGIKKPKVVHAEPGRLFELVSEAADNRKSFLLPLNLSLSITVRLLLLFLLSSVQLPSRSRTAVPFQRCNLRKTESAIEWMAMHS